MNTCLLWHARVDQASLLAPSKAVHKRVWEVSEARAFQNLAYLLPSERAVLYESVHKGLQRLVVQDQAIQSFGFCSLNQLYNQSAIRQKATRERKVPSGPLIAIPCSNTAIGLPCCWFNIRHARSTCEVTQDVLCSTFGPRIISTLCYWTSSSTHAETTDCTKQALQPHTRPLFSSLFTLLLAASSNADNCAVTHMPRDTEYKPHTRQTHRS